jgi:hypothetical protein
MITVSITVGRIEVGDSRLESGIDHLGRLFLIDLARKVVASKADQRHRK